MQYPGRRAARYLLFTIRYSLIPARPPAGGAKFIDVAVAFSPPFWMVLCTSMENEK